MSVILMARRRAITKKEKKIIVRKAGCKYDGGFTMGEETTAWLVKLGGEKDPTPTRISFSRDSMSVMIDGECVDTHAYKSDEDYDLDLIFYVNSTKCQIYSDVEGTTMTNYLFVDDRLIDQVEVKNCASKHRPNNTPSQCHKK